jgi:protein-tyrosine phosphatase
MTIYTCLEASLNEDPKNKVMVHCNMGISRSSAIVIMFLMRYLKMSYDEAHAHVKMQRSYIRPNATFEKELRTYEKEILQ